MQDAARESGSLVKIVMIGHSNAGKTTYMSMMYQVMSSGVRGFHVVSRSAEQAAELSHNAELVRQGQYPPPSSRRSLYRFGLVHSGRKFFNFTWHDYRGGALSDKATEADTAAVMADLKSADGIIVFADAARLDGTDAGGREVRRLVTLTQMAIDSSQAGLPVVIAYTKADTVAQSRWPAVVQPFQPLDVAARGSTRVNFATVRVSCGGQPSNVEVPVLWCLAHGIVARIDHLQSKVKRLNSAARKEASQATVWNSISSFFKDETSHAQRAERARAKASATLAKLKPLERPAQKLKKALGKLDTL